ncbi:amino acid ABC transporter ATP-binding protein [Ancylobacter defluvii]|uniref:Histidine/lysine/arginine/ornithine ABC transporter ATP-binding protein HisP n=1 Tax=Ancylobacter defluvii TaxID=1282440 RepID=A0A9W6JWF2_9HYPH|nr:amino acid ABC transporter ATP-binding protein [Ancylobacter defluvii]MBS7588528.1 amino acid ABC transporter ATP-binding protein [Ancylobacter defluvii]GLK83808.1 histidine/lysine/arginine/ornithine ABC transporter ATP-binding protein HisP [Ancylobacter defluvii]
MTTDNVIEISGLRKSFGAHEVLKGIDLVVPKGKTVVLLGASGSGKSTLLRCVNFLETPTAGTVAFNGRPVGTPKGAAGERSYSDRELRVLRARIGIVFQQFNLFPHMTALENIMEGQRAVLGRSREEAAARAEDLLARVGLAGRGGAYPSHLSGGQQQRVAICRALAMDPDVMLFDEATSALDPELVGEVLRTMRSLREDGMTMLIVTHELGFAYHIADEVVFLSEGRIYEQGPPEQVMLHPKGERTRQFMLGHSEFRLPHLD